eukprot:15974-Eustigmatos_ZCMA.PRE.1
MEQVKELLAALVPDALMLQKYIDLVKATVWTRKADADMEEDVDEPECAILLYVLFWRTAWLASMCKR